jgi:hypothetical protein
MIPPQLDEQNVRKRILLFYFAAGLNLCMGMYVFAAGASQGGGSLTFVALIFIAFAALNFYVARMLRKRLDAAVRGRQTPP